MGAGSFKKVLLIRFGGLGDILLATPLLREIAKANPSAEIDFMVGRGMVDVLSGHPNIHEIIGFDKNGVDVRGLAFLKWLWKVNRSKYDLVVNLHPSVKTHLMTYAAIPRRMVFYKKTKTLDPVTGRSVHAVDDYGKELQQLGFPRSASDQLDFVVPADAAARVAGRLESHSASGKPLVVINPAASQPVNRWDADRFRAVAHHFAGQAQVAIIGAPRSSRSSIDGLDEVDLADSVAGGDARVLNLAGQLSIKELGALIERAGVIVTCDTGPMHIAAALHTPTVALFGSADPDRTGPLNPNAVVLNDASLSCLPCRKRTCFRGDIACMANLSVQRVISSMEEVLARGKRSLAGGEFR